MSIDGFEKEILALKRKFDGRKRKKTEEKAKIRARFSKNRKRALTTRRLYKLQGSKKEGSCGRRSWDLVLVDQRK